MLPRYYHIVVQDGAPHSPDHPWQINYSAGAEFSPNGRLNFDRPIFFIAFGDHDTGRRLARQPLTVGSLLETCSVWSEMATVSETLFEPTPENKVELSLWGQEKTRFLYDLNFTQYVAPAHLLSVEVGTKDPFLTFERASALARICLNLTPDHFEALQSPKEFEPFGERRRTAFISNRDRGYAFACIVHHAPKYDPSIDTDCWLSEALLATGLPDIDRLRADVVTYFNSLKSSSELNSNLRKIRDKILRIGLDVCEKTNAGAINAFTLINVVNSDIPTPRIFDRECNFLRFPTVVNTDDHDPVGMFDAEHRLREEMLNVLVGCRGFPEA